MLEKLRYYIGQFFLSYVFVAAAIVVDSVLILSYPMRWIGLANYHRRLVACLTHYHWTLLPAIAQCWSNVEVNLHVRPEDLEKLGKERAILISNHRYQLDWLAVWVLALNFGVLEYFRALVKDPLKFVPVVGWGMWLNDFVFLKRNVKTDTKILAENFKNLSNFDCNYWLMLFCEGTRLTPAKHKLSVEFAIKNGRKPLKHHLMPRTKGFCLVRRGLDGDVPALYDITVACPGANPPVLADFSSGKHSRVDLLLRRVPLKMVPYDESECREYLEELYQTKDKLCDFYIKHDRFPLQGEDLMYKGFITKPIRPKTSTYVVATMWAAVLIPPLLIYFCSVLLNGISLKVVLSAVFVCISVGVTSRSMMKSGSVSSSYGQKS